MADYPKVKDWEALKKKYKIPNGAVKGVQVGKAIETFHKGWDTVSGPTAAKKRIPIGQALENSLAAYISALSKKKKDIKQYPAFEKEFLDKYLGRVNFLKEDLKRYDADAKLYTAELAKFFSAVHRLQANKAKVTRDDIIVFKGGPMRGLSALGKSVKKVDPTKIDALLGPINLAVDKFPAILTREQIDKFVDKIVETADEVAELARAQNLVPGAK